MSSQTLPSSTAFNGIKLLAVFALVFGALTLFSAGSVLFGPDEARELAGNYVGIVVWFNFMAGGTYLVAAIGLWLGKAWAVGLSYLIAIATALIAGAFIFVILQGGAFEMRTVGALAFRGTFWLAAALIAHRAMKRT